MKKNDFPRKFLALVYLFAVTFWSSGSLSGDKFEDCYDSILPLFDVSPDGNYLLFSTLSFEKKQKNPNRTPRKDDNCDKVTQENWILDLESGESAVRSMLESDLIPKDLDVLVSSYSDSTTIHRIRELGHEELLVRDKLDSVLPSAYRRSPLSRNAFDTSHFRFSQALRKEDAGRLDGYVFSGIERFRNRKGKLAKVSIPEELYIIAEREAAIDPFESVSTILHPRNLSRNGCWLIAAPQLKGDADFDSGRLSVYALHQEYGGESVTSQIPTSETEFPYCLPPQASGGETNNPNFSPELLPSREQDKPHRADGRWYGFDFSSYTNSHKSLEIVWQRGSENDSENESNKIGELTYNFLSFDDGIANVNKSIDITKECKISNGELPPYTGSEQQPYITEDGEILFFIAEAELGNEASHPDLFAVPFDEIKNGNCMNIQNLTKKIDYPVTQYSIFSGGTELALKIIYNGQARILFYAIESSDTGSKILYKNRHVIKNMGFIYDFSVVENIGEGARSLEAYISASHANYPPSIYRCVLLLGKFKCQDKLNPLVTNTAGEIISATQNNHEEIGYLEYPIIESDRLISETEQIQVNQTTHRIVLLPKGYEKKRKACLKDQAKCPPIVLSIHGGPQSAWVHNFSIREFMLAELGFVVVMPNPIGSIGFGQAYTDAVNNNWATETIRNSNTVYDGNPGPVGQILELINNISDTDNSNGEFLSAGPLFALGHSYGGYMMLWMQANEDLITGNKPLGYVSVNGVMDLLWFAYNTDHKWFPNHQLGCSGDEVDRTDNGACGKFEIESFSVDFNCICVGLNMQCDFDTATKVLLEQNPICHVDGILGNEYPLLLVYGDNDVRVVPDQQSIKVKNLAQESSNDKDQVTYVRKFPSDFHALKDGSNKVLGVDLACWFYEITPENRRGGFDIPERLDCADRLARNIEYLGDPSPQDSEPFSYIHNPHSNRLFNLVLDPIDRIGAFDLLTNSYQ